MVIPLALPLLYMYKLSSLHMVFSMCLCTSTYIYIHTNTHLHKHTHTVQFANVKVKTLEEIHHEKNPSPPSTQPARTTITPTSFNLQTVLNTPISSPTQNTPASTHQQQFTPSKIHMQPKTFASMIRAGFVGNASPYSIFNPNYQTPFQSRRGRPSVPGRTMRGFSVNRVWKPDISHQSTPSQQTLEATATPTYVTTELVSSSQNSTPSQPTPCVIQVSPLPTDNGIPHQAPPITPVSSKSIPPQIATWDTMNDEVNGTADVSNKSTAAMRITTEQSVPLRTVREIAGDSAPIQPTTALQNTKVMIVVALRW